MSTAIALSASASASAAAASSKARDVECLVIIDQQKLASVEEKQAYSECVMRLHPSQPIIPENYQPMAAFVFLAIWVVCAVYVYNTEDSLPLAVFFGLIAAAISSFMLIILIALVGVIFLG